MLLRNLRMEDEGEAVRAHELLALEGFPFLFGFTPGDAFAPYVERVDAFNEGGSWSEGGVPGTFLLAENAGTIVGRLSVRYALNDELRLYGGHIGYCTLPAHRRRGYATRMLEAGIELARQAGEAEVLVTCDEDNVGSRAVIEHVGGEFSGIVGGDSRVRKRHYWFR